MHRKTVADGTKYLGALFFGLINVMFNGFAELAMTMQRLQGFYKQRDMLLYPSWAFTLPIWIFRIPISLVESGIWILLTYFGVGFAPEPERYVSSTLFTISVHTLLPLVWPGFSQLLCLVNCRFWRQFLILFLLHQMSLVLFRLIASIGRSMIVANTFGSFALLVVFVLGGFIVARGK